MPKKRPTNITLDPPFKIKRTKLQGINTIMVKHDKNTISVQKTSQSETIEPDEDGYVRQKVTDSWEY